MSKALIAVDVSGHGEPIVLLHGVGANRSIWRAVTPLLAADRRVVAPDIPGFGSSPALATHFDLDETAAALADELVTRIGEPFDLVGNSLGGAVAVAVAERRPELVRRLVLAAPAGLTPYPSLVCVVTGRIAGPWINVRRLLGTPLAATPAGRRLALAGTIHAADQLDAETARAVLQASRGSRSIGSAVSAVMSADLAATIAQLRVPVGYIWGAQDRVVPMRSVGALLGDKPVEVIDAAGHVPQVEQPAEFITVLRRLLSRLSVTVSTQTTPHPQVH